jgi:hypothetical protein
MNVTDIYYHIRSNNQSKNPAAITRLRTEERIDRRDFLCYIDLTVTGTTGCRVWQKGQGELLALVFCAFFGIFRG